MSAWCEHDGAIGTCATCGRRYCFECKEPGVVEVRGRLHMDIASLCHACRVKDCRRVVWTEDADPSTVTNVANGILFDDGSRIVLGTAPTAGGPLRGYDERVDYAPAKLEQLVGDVLGKP